MFLVAAVSVLGWWRPVLFEVRKAKPGWLIIGPVFMGLAALVILVTGDFSATTASMVGLAILGSIGVGFSEETATRGVLLTGFRARYSEPMVWFLTSALFGLMHLPNWFFGVGPKAVAQVFLAFGTGTMLYLARRLTGNLFVPMFLHGFWDFAVIFFLDTGDPTLLPGRASLTVTPSVLAVVFVFILLRRERGLAPQRPSVLGRGA